MLLKEKFSEIAADAWDTIYPKELKSIITNNWPKIRKIFIGNPSRSLTIRVPYSLVQRNPQAREPMFKVTGSEIERVFKPVVQRIGSLVRKQFNAIMKKGKPPKVSPRFMEMSCLYVSATNMAKVHHAGWRIRPLQVPAHLFEYSIPGFPRPRNPSVPELRAVSYLALVYLSCTDSGTVGPPSAEAL